MDKKLMIGFGIISLFLLSGCYAIQDMQDKKFCDVYNPDKETYDFTRYIKGIKDYHHYDEEGNYQNFCEFKNGIPQANCEVRYYDACIFCPKDKIEDKYFCRIDEVEVEVTNYAQD